MDDTVIVPDDENGTESGSVLTQFIGPRLPRGPRPVTVDASSTILPESLNEYTTLKNGHIPIGGEKIKPAIPRIETHVIYQNFPQIKTYKQRRHGNVNALGQTTIRDLSGETLSVTGSNSSVT